MKDEKEKIVVFRHWRKVRFRGPWQKCKKKMIERALSNGYIPAHFTVSHDVLYWWEAYAGKKLARKAWEEFRSIRELNFDRVSYPMP